MVVSFVLTSNKIEIVNEASLGEKVICILPMIGRIRRKGITPQGQESSLMNSDLQSQWFD